MVAVPGTRFPAAYATGLDGVAPASEAGSDYQLADLANTANMQNDTGAFTPSGASQTLTTAQLINGLLRVTAAFGGAGSTLTTPTAAQIVAAFPAVQVGSSFDFTLLNTSGQTQTLAAGSGCTVVGTSLLAITTAHNGWWRFVVTNVGVGTEAVELYHVSAAVL